MEKRPDDLAPETVNAEQADESTQAADVAQDAIDRATSTQGLEDSEKDKSGISDSADAQDIVDHMKQMDTSGQIDMDAYRGEETMDDLENRYGKARVADEDFRNDDS